VALKRGHAGVADVVRAATRVTFSSIVTGELLYGFRNGSRYQKNRADLETFLARERVDFLPVTLDTADRFGRIMAALRKAGCPIPTNDAWIAAHAMESGSELITFDAHFDRVPGLPFTRPET
jgi:tRNA(fMet)-specific endonuclease VapC